MTDQTPLTDQQLDEIDAKAAELRERLDRKNPWPSDNESHWMAEGWKNGTRNALDKLHPAALVAEVRRLRAELAAEQAQHRYTLRQRNNRSERLQYLQTLANTGQVELLAEEAKDILSASINDHLPADDDEMAASLRRDGFGDDEIADMLGPGVTDGEAPEPTLLRWGLDDVMYGDDESTIVMLSGPEGEPYWLKLDPERAAVLRQNLAGPDGADEEPETGTRQCGHDDYHDPHEWADRPGVWCPGHSLTEDAARPAVSQTT